MGVYVNPPSELYLAKELWLLEQLNQDKAKEMTKIDFIFLDWEDVPEDKVLLVVFDNVDFTAILVIYDERELEYIHDMIISGRDPRQKFFLLADKETAMKYAN